MRKQIFVDEQGIPSELDADGKDENSVHVFATDKQGNIVASGRLTVQNHEGTLSRIAVAKEYRGQSIGKEIVTELEKQARKLHLQKLSLSPHAYLEKFYSGLGYITEPNGEHTVGKYTLLTMKKEI
jgi:predicted GNAT family N-acyltransferase